MVRSALIARIAAQHLHLYAKDVEAMVATVLDTMADALARADQVELSDFGSFAIRQIEARSARDP